ncbi:MULTISPECIES: SDR family NAD(P)-dependent oxidoreductase [Subtercola]|uniref:SDR family oxidoreductase n=1 Tax=Subtercola vilae TaxID=2056433 RepID=A0A4V6U5F2_9MICO|nr:MULTISPECIES: SDR family oxidoreductase [Subtercola]MEA9985149.1 SDR family oxidoreductase [Subtercola sp. RTI3]TIH37654.1 SDR family oxidoreductase [Subtercola vilae]
MDLQLSGRVVLVVGGAGYIGAAIVARAREEQAVVVVASRRAVDGIVMDARDDESVAAGVKAVIEQHGRLDAVVVTAAPSARTLDASKNGDPGQVAEAFDAKAIAFLRVANAVAPVMRAAGYGRIVGISGQNAFVTGNMAGSIRNAALIIAAKNLADDLAGTGVSVTTVSPGVVADNPATAVEPGAAGQSSPAQIADLVTFLVSPRAAVSGESIAVGHRVRGAISF